LLYPEERLPKTIAQGPLPSRGDGLEPLRVVDINLLAA